MSEKRTRRISEEIKKIISSLLLDGIKDPRIDDLASVTHVDLSNDYSLAKIYISTFNEDKLDDTIEGLNSAKGFIKREISKNLDLRIVPEIIFYKDESIKKTFELFEKLESMKRDNNGNF